MRRLCSTSSSTSDGSDFDVDQTLRVLLAPRPPRPAQCPLPAALWHDLLLPLDRAFPKTMTLGELRGIHTITASSHTSSLPTDLRFDALIDSWLAAGYIDFELRPSPTNDDQRRVFITTSGSQYLGAVQDLVQDKSALAVLESAFASSTHAQATLDSIRETQDDRTTTLGDFFSAHGIPYTQESVSAHLARHIARLHEYNEIKDTAQSAIGRIAAVQGKTVSEVYADLELDVAE
ncbi:swi5-like zinc finger protein [Sorochytrium milnesiophthora]